MTDVSPDIAAMTEAMRDQLDSVGVELTTDVLKGAAIAAFTSLTRPGGVLDSENIEGEVRKAIAVFRGDDLTAPAWPPHRWVNAIVHKLGEAALVTGLLLNEDGHSKTEDAVYFDRFESQMIAVSAAAQEAIVGVRNAREEGLIGT
jgi:hypothetical protein